MKAFTSVYREGSKIPAIDMGKGLRRPVQSLEHSSAVAAIDSELQLLYSRLETHAAQSAEAKAEVKKEVQVAETQPVLRRKVEPPTIRLARRENDGSAVVYGGTAGKMNRRSHLTQDEIADHYMHTIRMRRDQGWKSHRGKQWR